MMDQNSAPLFEALLNYQKKGIYPFHTPGHKGCRLAPEALKRLLTPVGLDADLPSMEASDNTFFPTGCIREAQQLAAELVGASHSFFLTGGSSLGNMVAILATVKPGETLIVQRNAHRSVISAIILAGVFPHFISCHPSQAGRTPSASQEEILEALKSVPQAKAVLLTRPSYDGATGDLQAIVACCHKHSLPLIVDEAHGAHFHWLPEGYPTPALDAGADIVIQSWHKTVGSLTGSSMLHLGKRSKIQRQQIQDTLNLLQSTSPSYLLLASLDLARHQMWQKGKELFQKAVERAAHLKKDINQIPKIEVTESKDNKAAQDPLRLLIDLSQTGWTGYDAKLFLRQHFQLEVEMEDFFHLVLILSPNEEESGFTRLLNGLKAISQQSKPLSPIETINNFPPCTFEMTPKEAAMILEKEMVPLEDAIGQVAAEMILFYPPGIPEIIPGQLITKEAVSICQKLLNAGAVPYASDLSLKTIAIVQSSKAQRARS